MTILRHWTLLSLAFFALLPARAQQAPLSAGDIYKKASPAVVLIEVYGLDGKVSGAGSGFLVSGDGKIITNYHVIAHTKQATVRLANQDAYDTVQVLEIDKRKDIAILKIQAVGLPYVVLGHSAGVEVGETVFSLSNPLGDLDLQNTLSQGIVSGIRQGDGYHYFQITAPISHGSSGSPVFNASGEVIGITVATLEEGQNLNFAIPIDYANGMLLSTLQPRSLESVYEPEPVKEESAAATASPNAAPPTPDPGVAAKALVVVPQPTEELKLDAPDYLVKKVGTWTRADAEKEFGDPFARRDALAVKSTVVIGDVYRYKSPAVQYSDIELNFDRTSRTLTAAYLYPASQVSWATLEAKMGKNYKKVKMQNGRPGYMYQVGQHVLFVTVDSQDNVVNLGVW
jgi:S1-C subfamily serine protease